MTKITLEQVNDHLWRAVVTDSRGIAHHAVGQTSGDSLINLFEMQPQWLPVELSIKYKDS